MKMQVWIKDQKGKYHVIPNDILVRYPDGKLGIPRGPVTDKVVNFWCHNRRYFRLTNERWILLRSKKGYKFPNDQ